MSLCFFSTRYDRSELIYSIFLKNNHLVALYNFQESPTGELADDSLSTGKEPSEQEPPDPELKAESTDPPCVSEEADENNSEEGESIERHFFFFFYNP